jgi:hypothetical protein
VGKSVVIFNGQPSEIVSVVEEFHYNCLHQQIGLSCFNNNKNNSYVYLLVKMGGYKVSAMLQQLEETFRKFIPASFEYTFLDQQMKKYHESEAQLSLLVLMAAGAAVFTALMGLYHARYSVT